MDKNELIGFRLSLPIKQAAQKAAAAERRTVSSLLEKLLFDHLSAQGFLGQDNSHEE